MKVTQWGPTLCDPLDYPHGTLQGRILDWVAFPFSRGIFPTQGSNPGLPHCRQILHQLSHRESTLEWAPYPLLQQIFPTQDRTRVSCIQANSLPTELSGTLMVRVSTKSSVWMTTELLAKGSPAGTTI